MPQVKRAAKGKRPNKAVSVLGIAGMSLSLVGGASAAIGGAATDIASQNTSPGHAGFLGEEEISDVSLSTFYVFDKENAVTPRVGDKLAWGCGCRGCRGCGVGFGGCGCGGGCGGCGWGFGWGGGCCLSWGGCALC